MKPIIMMLSCVASALLVVALLSLTKASGGIATFDLQRVQGQFIHQLALHNASRELVNTSSASFKRKLQQVLDVYAREKRVVILDLKQVLASHKDVTDQIIPRLARAMREQS